MRRNVRKLAGNKTVENMLVMGGEHIASFQNNGNMKYHQTILVSIKKAEKHLIFRNTKIRHVNVCQSPDNCHRHKPDALHNFHI